MPGRPRAVRRLIGSAASLDSKRGLLLGVRPRVRPGRRLHAAGGDRRPGGQRARRDRAGAGVPRGRRRGGGVPGAVPDRLRHRRPAAPGHAARGRRTRRSHEVVRGIGRPAAGARRRRAAGARHPGAQLRGRRPPRPGPRACARSPTCRPTASSTSAATSRRATTGAAPRSRSCGAEVPFGPDLIFAATDVPDLKLHVEICEDMWVPVPPSAEAVAGRRDRAGQPVRQPDHRRPRRGPPAAGPQRERTLQRGVRLRRRRARASRRPTCAGTARRWSTSAAS